MKKKFLFLIQIIIFFCILFLLLQRISLAVTVYGTAEDSTDRRTRLLFTLPKNTVDVLLGGTSHTYCTLNPQQIYDETGITSASFATSAQSVKNTYWLLKEALKRQSPKIFVMDLSAMASSVSPSAPSFRLHYTSGITNLPDFSINKFLAYKDITSENKGWAKDMTPYDAWGILEFKDDYDRNAGTFRDLLQTLLTPAVQFKTFGFMAADTVYPMKRIRPPKSKKYVDLKTTVEYEYLEKIYNLCSSHNVQLFFIQAPFDYDFDNCHLYEQTISWADERNVDFINYFDLLEELNINPQTDMRDNDHLNYLGSQKATSYFSEYLTAHYNLPNHKGDTKYKLWERRSFDYAAVQERILSQIQPRSGTSKHT